VDLTIPAALARAARDHADSPALAEPDGPRLSYRQLHEQVTLVSRALMAEGVDAGDRVAIWSPNTHHWVLSALGALSVGATLVPVSTRFTGLEALDVISRSGAGVLVVAGWFLGIDRYAKLRAAASTIKSQPRPSPPNAIDSGPSLKRLRLVIRLPIEAAPEAGPATSQTDDPGTAAIDWQHLAGRASQVPPPQAEARAAAVGPEDVADILFTSGTTGRSKGAVSTHQQDLGVATAWAECAQLTSDDRYLVVNPFFHSFGYKAGILACLVSGATLVPMRMFHAGLAMQLIESERITVLPGAPTIYQTLLDYPTRPYHDLSSLRLAVTGAAMVPVALVERMRRQLTFDTVLTAYGLTEAVVATMCRPGDAAEIVASSSGRATAGFEVRIAGPDGEPASPGQPGEILLRGPNVMVGYLDDPAATREAIDADGWLHTGDVGHLDPEGYLTITDRLKDMYICGGFNVYPAEVEQALARLDGVAESAVIGMPDERLGEVGWAYVVPQPGQQLTAGRVIEFCQERLASYKVPRQVMFCSALPRNASGKTLKRVLREEAG
jgi:HIP---CoA ligase